MRILNFFDFINEGVIVPEKIDDIISDLKSIDNPNSLDDINSILNRYDVHFCHYDEFYNSLKNKKEQEEAPRKSDIVKNPSPIKFALFNKYVDKIMVVVEDEFIKMFNMLKSNKFFHNELSEILNHEYIHSKQVHKMGVDKYKLTTPNNPEKYFSDKQEIMAYANSFVNQMKNQRYSKEEILDLLRKEKYINSWVFKAYKKHVNRKDFNKFIKYAYQYLDKIYV